MRESTSIGPERGSHLRGVHQAPLAEAREAHEDAKGRHAFHRRRVDGAHLRRLVALQTAVRRSTRRKSTETKYYVTIRAVVQQPGKSRSLDIKSGFGARCASLAIRRRQCLNITSLSVP